MKKEEFIRRTNPKYLNGIAHRGLHNDLFTENSIGAFKNAIEHGYAFEFDVHLTKDNDLIICHDSELERVTGKKGWIEDLTVKEIKENYRLHDGSQLITLKELMEVNQERVPFVLEIKEVNKNGKEIGNKVVEQLKDIKDKKNVVVISFHPKGLRIAKKAGYVTQLLLHRTRFEVRLLSFLFDGIDIDKEKCDSKFVKRYHKKHFVNVWTIQSQEEYEKVKNVVDTITFENFIPKL